MELEELEKKTVTDLREMAGQYDDIEGVSGMKKEDLVDALCKKLGIKKRKSLPKGIGRHAMKERISALRKRRDQALEAHDHKELKRARTLLRRSRHKLRLVVARAAHAEKVANQGKKPSAEQAEPAS